MTGLNPPLRNPSQFRQYNPSENNHPNEGKPHEADAYISIDQNTIHFWYSPLNDSIVLILLSIHMELRPPAWALRCSPLYVRHHNYTQPHITSLIIYPPWFTIKDGLLCSCTSLWSPCKSPRVVLGLHFDICNSLSLISLTSCSTSINLSLITIRPNIHTLSELLPLPSPSFQLLSSSSSFNTAHLVLSKTYDN
jgi:hypothetical protein